MTVTGTSVVTCCDGHVLCRRVHVHKYATQCDGYIHATLQIEVWLPRKTSTMKNKNTSNLGWKRKPDRTIYLFIESYICIVLRVKYDKCRKKLFKITLLYKTKLDTDISKSKGLMCNYYAI